MMCIMIPVNNVLSDTWFTVPSGVFHGLGTNFTALYVLATHRQLVVYSSAVDRQLILN